MTKNRKLKAIELFAGAGGMALGIQQSGIDVVGAVETDKNCVATLQRNKERFFPKMQIIQDDITALTGRSLLRKVGLKKRQLDILSGGPPCQGFSTANVNRSTKDPRSKLMWQFIRMVKEIQPRYFVIENVPGLLSFKDFFRLLLKSLEECGYVVRFNLLDAASYGVPQRRRRVFIDGARNDLNLLPVYPAPTHFDLDREEKGDSFISPWLVAQKCFALHGFSEAEIEGVWWNKTLEILMIKKTAAEQVDQAIHEILLETVCNSVTRSPKEKTPKGQQKFAFA